MNKTEQKDSWNVRLDIPYPPVQAESRRSDYANAMLSNVGSSNSEMSAVSLYFYNSVLLRAEDAAFAGCFHQIGIVEMHHLDIFATLAFQMGLDPRLWSMDKQKPCYWTPAYNCYPSRRLREVIENAIQGEEAAVEKYTWQAEHIQDANIRKNLERILMDEHHHIKLFNQMLTQLGG